MRKKQKKILKNKIENIIIKVLGFIVFTSPVLFYILACYITSFVK